MDGLPARVRAMLGTLVTPSVPRAAFAGTRAAFAGTQAAAPGPGRTARAPMNAACHPSFWDDGEWRTYSRALGLPQDEGWYHRKAWEWAQCIYGLERLGVLGPGRLALGVGAGHERTLYYLANRTALTVATDLYSGDFAASPAEEADPSFLREPARFAPFTYYRERLLGLPADGCRLPFREAVFDVVYSLSSIEHFGGHERASEAVREMCRVLRPGGVACVATELVLEGGPHPAYFEPGDLMHYVVELSGMELVEPLSDLRPPKAMMDDPVRLPEEYLRTPHIVLQEGQWKFTSVCLFMRKPAQQATARPGSASAAADLVRRLRRGLSRPGPASRSAQPGMVAGRRTA